MFPLISPTLDSKFKQSLQTMTTTLQLYWKLMWSACTDHCKCLSSVNVLFKIPNNRPGKQQTRRYWQRQGPEIPLIHAHRADQSWNVTLTSWVQQERGKYSWHTNRKWLEPPHNGVSCTSPPHHTIPHFSLTHLCLWSLKIIVLILPPTPHLTLYNSPHIPLSTSSSAPSWPTPSSQLKKDKSSNENKKLYISEVFPLKEKQTVELFLVPA